jgi:hypothetical protein
MGGIPLRGSLDRAKKNLVAQLRESHIGQAVLKVARLVQPQAVVDLSPAGLGLPVSADR